jgi:hypothetical protein
VISGWQHTTFFVFGLSIFSVGRMPRLVHMLFSSSEDLKAGFFVAFPLHQLTPTLGSTPHAPANATQKHASARWWASSRPAMGTAHPELGVAVSFWDGTMFNRIQPWSSEVPSLGLCHLVSSCSRLCPVRLGTSPHDSARSRLGKMQRFVLCMAMYTTCGVCSACLEERFDVLHHHVRACPL